jgi:PAS domain S-box-containing protein
MVSHSKDYAILMLDPAGRIMTWNEGAERIKGYGAEEIIGEHFSRFYSAEDRANGRPDFELAEATKNERFENEGWRVRKDGSRFFASVVITVLRDEKGLLRGFGKITRDITERKKSEEHLAKTLRDLERSNVQLQQFANFASHDLQEPLRMVTGYTKLLSERYTGRLDSDADEFIAYAVDGCTRMKVLIEDLLVYARSGTDGRALREICSEDALEGALNNLRAAIEESGAIVTHDRLPAITTDHALLTQVFQNLVGNAIKYRSTAVPHIHISAMKSDRNEWIFSVQDNGLGIAAHDFERIFIIFQRLHRRQELSGSGIGLAICKKIVEDLGGRIWVESQPEKGSTFYFAVPESGSK